MWLPNLYISFSLPFRVRFRKWTRNGSTLYREGSLYIEDYRSGSDFENEPGMVVPYIEKEEAVILCIEKEPYIRGLHIPGLFLIWSHAQNTPAIEPCNYILVLYSYPHQILLILQVLCLIEPCNLFFLTDNWQFWRNKTSPCNHIQLAWFNRESQ